MFEVEWIETAAHRLANAWLGADSKTRAAITAASHEIDDLLMLDPVHAGESRDVDRRIVIAEPLAATYVVDEDRQRVTVLDVVLRKPRRR
jgi:hypothetical protein